MTLFNIETHHPTDLPIRMIATVNTVVSDRLYPIAFILIDFLIPNKVTQDWICKENLALEQIMSYLMLSVMSILVLCIIYKLQGVG